MCAVVGSSSTLLGSNYGELIDSHDVVIRCNQAFTQGFETDVGSKFSIRFINGHNFCATNPNWPSRTSTVERHPTFDPDFLRKVKGETIVGKDYETARNETPGLLPKIREHNKLLFVHPEFKAYCSRLVHRDPTTGLVATLCALRLFNKVSCFGFRMGSDGYHHYYEQIVQYDQSVHSFDCEYQKLTELHKSGKLVLYP